MNTQSLELNAPATVPQNSTGTPAESKPLKFLIAGLVILLPWALTVLIVRVFLGANLVDLIPTREDEVVYWHQIASFVRAGFNGGYFTVGEHPSKAAFIHFYAHGPFFPILNGLLGRAVGWYPYSMIFFNVAYMSAALLIFILVVKPTIKQLLVMGAVLLTFYPLLMFSSWTMQETMQQAFAVALAASVYLFIRQRERGWAALACGLTIAFIALVRVTWALLFIPFFLMLWWRAPLWKRLAALVVGGILFAIYTAVGQWWIAPFPWKISLIFEQIAVSPLDGLLAWWEHITTNLSDFFQGMGMWLMQRGQMVALVVLFTLVGLIGALRRSRPVRWLLGADVSSTEILFHVFSLLLILALNTVIHENSDWRDFRISAPHLLASLFLLIAFRRTRLVLLFCALNLLFLPEFIQQYPILKNQPLAASQAQYAEFQRLFDGAGVVFDPDTDNAWCNTVLLDYIVAAPVGHQIPNRGAGLIALPQGMGVSFWISRASLPFKSQYILMLLRDFTDAQKARLHLQLLDRNMDAILYRNLDADC